MYYFDEQYNDTVVDTLYMPQKSVVYGSLMQFSCNKSSWDAYLHKTFEIKKIIYVITYKTIAIICYITIIGWLIAYFSGKENKNSLSRYHLKQAFGLFIFSVILNVISFGIRRRKKIKHLLPFLADSKYPGRYLHCTNLNN